MSTSQFPHKYGRKCTHHCEVRTVYLLLNSFSFFLFQSHGFIPITYIHQVQYIYLHSHALQQTDFETKQHLSPMYHDHVCGCAEFLKVNIIMQKFVHWCFEPGQPQRITSGLEININPSTHIKQNIKYQRIFLKDSRSDITLV